MKKCQIAVLDDYQNAALESADWSVLRDRADITVFQDHLADPDDRHEESHFIPFCARFCTTSTCESFSISSGGRSGTCGLQRER